ncbi:Tlg2-vesicle protein [Mucor circinelloides]
MKSAPHSQPILALLICVFSMPIPPLSAFILSVYMAGYVYGPKGGIPATLGAFFGALLAYGFVQKMRTVRWFTVPDNLRLKLKAVSRAIEQGGFKMVLMMRLSPLPWQITNLVLSLCDKVSFGTYALAAFISSFKINADVWFGSQLANLSRPDTSPEALTVNRIITIAGFIVSTITAFSIYRSTKQKIKECEEEQEQVHLLSQQEECALSLHA